MDEVFKVLGSLVGLVGLYVKFSCFINSLSSRLYERTNVIIKYLSSLFLNRSLGSNFRSFYDT